jgi:hypothetical protein
MEKIIIANLLKRTFFLEIFFISFVNVETGPRLRDGIICTKYNHQEPLWGVIMPSVELNTLLWEQSLSYEFINQLVSHFNILCWRACTSFV